MSQAGHSTITVTLASLLLVMSATGLTGCGARGQPAPVGPHGGTQRYQITVVEAALAARRPDGSRWHVRAPDGALPVLGGLVGLAVGAPGIGLAMGEALEGGPHGHPPNPMVELKIGTTTLATLPAGPTLAPVWRYPMAFHTGGYDASEPVILLIRDAYDQGVIGQARLTLGELLGQPVLRLYDLGSVVTLDIAVEPLPQVPAPAIHRFVVPGNASARALRQSETTSPAPGAWHRVPVLNGDVVRIRAAGTICPSSWDSHLCYDANGAPDRWQSYNHDAFASAPHAALVGVYADIPIMAGTQTVFRAARSGWLLLFINDTDPGNNTGSLQVTVEVNPPQNAERGQDCLASPPGC